MASSHKDNLSVVHSDQPTHRKVFCLSHRRAKYFYMGTVNSH